MPTILLEPIGRVSSSLVRREDAPKQGSEGAPEAWIELAPAVAAGAKDLQVGDEILVLTWLDRGDRSVLETRPRDDPKAKRRGVFSTRSPDRPNPIGIHRVAIVEIAGGRRIRVDAIEAIDGTPVVDIKPVLDPRRER